MPDHLGNRTTYELIERLRDSPALGALLQGHGPYQHVVVDEVTPVPGVVGNRAIAQALTANDSSRTDLRITSAGGAAEAQAESVARGADTTITPVTEAGGAVPPDSVRSVLARPSQAGRALPEVVRADLKGRLGSDLSQVRVHTDPSALAAAEALDANAFTVGAHIYLGGGADPESASGRRLLAHEAVHVAQQAGTAAHIQLERKTKSRTQTVTKITFFVDRDIVVLELDGKDTITLKAIYNGRPPAGNYIVTGGKSTPPVGGVANARGWVVEWTNPPATTLTKAPSYTFSVVAGRPGTDEGPATGVTEQGAEKAGAEKAAAPKTPAASAPAPRGRVRPRRGRGPARSRPSRPARAPAPAAPAKSPRSDSLRRRRRSGTRSPS